MPFTRFSAVLQGCSRYSTSTRRGSSEAIHPSIERMFAGLVGATRASPGSESAGRPDRRGGAEIVQDALLAAWAAGLADATTVEDQAQRQARLLDRREHTR